MTKFDFDYLKKQIVKNYKSVYVGERYIKVFIFNNKSLFIPHAFVVKKKFYCKDTPYYCGLPSVLLGERPVGLEYEEKNYPDISDDQCESGFVYMEDIGIDVQLNGSADWCVKIFKFSNKTLKMLLKMREVPDNEYSKLFRANYDSELT